MLALLVKTHFSDSYSNADTDGVYGNINAENNVLQHRSGLNRLKITFLQIQTDVSRGDGEQRFSSCEAPDPGGSRSGRRGRKEGQEVKRREGTSSSLRSVMFELD